MLTVIYGHLDKSNNEEIHCDRFPTGLPFSVYLGWISVASVANITAFLVAYRWNRFGLSEQFWTGLMLIFLTLLTLIFLFKKKDYFYALTIIWALLGILYKRIKDTVSSDRAVEIAAVACLAIILLALILRAPAAPKDRLFSRENSVKITITKLRGEKGHEKVFNSFLFINFFNSGPGSEKQGCPSYLR